MNDIVRDALIAKIAELPEDRVSEIMDFVDFIRQREADRALTRAAMRASEPALARVWDNPDDDIYNEH